MAAPIKFKRPVGKDAETQPAIRVDCRGKRQNMYMKMRQIAVDVFATKQSTLAAMVLEDFVKEYETNPTGARVKRIMQVSMELKFPDKVSGKKGASPGGK